MLHIPHTCHISLFPPTTRTYIEAHTDTKHGSLIDTHAISHNSRFRPNRMRMYCVVRDLEHHPK